DASGSALVYSTFLGGTDFDVAGAMVVDSAGAAYVVGYTLSSDFPTTAGAFDTSVNGASDAFVTKFDPFFSTDASWSNYGTGWPGSNGVLLLTLSGNPVLCAEVTLNLANSRGATTTAALFVGLAQADLPTPYGGHLLVVPSSIVLFSLPGSGLAVTGTIS